MRRVLLCALHLGTVLPSLACSAYAAGKLATKDGSVMVSHSDDGGGASDPRISYIPAADHAALARRMIWPDLEDWPRYVGSTRGSTYMPLPGQTETQPVVTACPDGTTPQKSTLRSADNMPYARAPCC